MTAVVDEVGDREIILKMVDGRPGVVMRKDVTDVDGDVPQVGATIEVALLAREDPQGRMATSRGGPPSNSRGSVSMRRWRPANC